MRFEIETRIDVCASYALADMLCTLRHGMAILPVYEGVLKLGRERPDGILLDIGACCESLLANLFEVGALTLWHAISWRGCEESCSRRLPA